MEHLGVGIDCDDDDERSGRALMGISIREADRPRPGRQRVGVADG
jgi:hypothetical protein